MIAKVQYESGGTARVECDFYYTDEHNNLVFSKDVSLDETLRLGNVSPDKIVKRDHWSEVEKVK